jgi:hypothetical protein
MFARYNNSMLCQEQQDREITKVLYRHIDAVKVPKWERSKWERSQSGRLPSFLRKH